MDAKLIAQVNDMEASLVERGARPGYEWEATLGYEAGLHFQGRCAEIVMVDTEDGPVTGRCMRRVTTTPRPYKGYCDTTFTMELLPMCDGHADQRSHESHISEAEWAEIEKRQALFEEGSESAYYRQWG